MGNPWIPWLLVPISVVIALVLIPPLAWARSAAPNEPHVVVDHPLSGAKAERNQKRWARKGHYPAMPWLGRNRAKAPQRVRAGDAPGLSKRMKRKLRNRPDPQLGKNGKLIRLPQRGAKIPEHESSKDPTANASLFGYEGNFFSKRNAILAWVQSMYAAYVPAAGGRFIAPALYEVQDGTIINPCTGGVHNAAYCPPGNWVAWALGWSQVRWYDIGDMAWAVVLAHEYGHGAQQWLGYGNSGYFQYTVYREYFADCMAGAWTYYAYYNRIVDSVGRGDGNEFYDIFWNISNAVTTWDNHGDFNWRYGSAIYGWNYGFDGCVANGNWIYSQ